MHAFDKLPCLCGSRPHAVFRRFFRLDGSTNRVQRMIDIKVGQGRAVLHGLPPSAEHALVATLLAPERNRWKSSMMQCS
jgi:hypothetical protein